MNINEFLTRNTTCKHLEFFAGSLESAYGLLWGALNTLSQAFGRFMIIRPILGYSHWWECHICLHENHVMTSFCMS